ncbi:hypothetical protein Tco_0000507 [Tanacetum coccineum]
MFEKPTAVEIYDLVDTLHSCKQAPGAVDWKSKKQTTIAMSATQAEYMAASEAAMEAVWIRKFVGDLGAPDIFYGDNHKLREQVETGEIKILKVHTDDNLADPFTKALPRGKVTDLGNGIGLQLASSFMHTYMDTWQNLNVDNAYHIGAFLYVPIGQEIDSTGTVLLHIHLSQMEVNWYYSNCSGKLWKME